MTYTIKGKKGLVLVSGVTNGPQRTALNVVLVDVTNVLKTTDDYSDFVHEVNKIIVKQEIRRELRGIYAVNSG